jgi:hypothetical protein
LTGPGSHPGPFDNIRKGIVMIIEPDLIQILKENNIEIKDMGLLYQKVVKQISGCLRPLGIGLLLCVNEIEDNRFQYIQTHEGMKKAIILCIWNPVSVYNRFKNIEEMTEYYDIIIRRYYE